MCHRPVDAGAFEVDHTVPLSAGGQHVYANVRPVHPLCNRTGRPRL
jgi:5-methylcytosine-specific restriction endonuclease McrA